MASATQEKNFDTYNIGDKTYRKADFGSKVWTAIQKNSPGRFVDILEAKFAQTLNDSGKKISINK